MKEKDAEKLLAFYDKHIEKYGFGPQSVGWGSKSSQEIRFELLCGVGDLSGCSVLDIGCGTGDLCEYISKRYKNVNYSGIDINQKFIEKAKEKYPNISLKLAEFGQYNGEPFDYVLASGALSFKLKNHKKIYFSYIKKMYEISRLGVAFNMLKKGEHDDDETYATYDQKEIKEFCETFADEVELREDYLSYDFTVYLKKN